MFKPKPTKRFRRRGPEAEDNDAVASVPTQPTSRSTTPPTNHQPGPLSRKRKKKKPAPGVGAGLSFGGEGSEDDQAVVRVKKSKASRAVQRGGIAASLARLDVVTEASSTFEEAAASRYDAAALASLRASQRFVLPRTDGEDCAASSTDANADAASALRQGLQNPSASVAAEPEAGEDGSLSAAEKLQVATARRARQAVQVTGVPLEHDAARARHHDGPPPKLMAFRGLEAHDQRPPATSQVVDDDFIAVPHSSSSRRRSNAADRGHARGLGARSTLASQIAQLAEDEQDDQVRAWEDEAARRGAAAAGNLYHHHHHQQQRQQQPPPQQQPPHYDRSDLATAIARTARAVQGVIEQAEDAQARNQRHLAELTQQVADVLRREAELKAEADQTAKRFEFVQELREYVADLVGCLREKSAQLTEVQEVLMAAAVDATSARDQRRREAQNDAIQDLTEMGAIGPDEPRLEVPASSGSDGGGGEGEYDDFGRDRSYFKNRERERRCRERSARRANSWRRCERTNALPDADPDAVVSPDHLLSDAEDSDREVEPRRERHAALMQALDVVLDDVEDEYKDLSKIRRVFEDWKMHHPEAYRSAYASLALPKLVAPLVQAEVLRWPPLSVAVAMSSFSRTAGPDGPESATRSAPAAPSSNSGVNGAGLGFVGASGGGRGGLGFAGDGGSDGGGGSGGLGFVGSSPSGAGLGFVLGGSLGPGLEVAPTATSSAVAKVAQETPTGAVSLTDMNFVAEFADFGGIDEDAPPTAEADADTLLVPTVVESVVVPMLTTVVGEAYDPWSFRQTTALVSAVGDVLDFDPSQVVIAPMLAAPVARLTAAVDELHVPVLQRPDPCNRRASDLDSPAVSFVRRQVNCGLKLLRNLAQWAALLDPAVLGNLCLVRLLAHKLAPALACLADLPQGARVAVHALDLAVRALPGDLSAVGWAVALPAASVHLRRLIRDLDHAVIGDDGDLGKQLHHARHTLLAGLST